ncbi:hypothetical protein F5879DRAFT_800309, partial [Lentinula edodes]
SSRKAGRVFDRARGVYLFKRGSEEDLARFLKMGFIILGNQLYGKTATRNTDLTLQSNGDNYSLWCFEQTSPDS